MSPESTEQSYNEERGYVSPPAMSYGDGDQPGHPRPVDTTPEQSYSASGVFLIATERERQVREEGWSPEHDDEHSGAELLQAALCYASAARYGAVPGHPPHSWPWEARWWKAEPNDPIRNLVKAGALIAAEIDRVQREKAARDF